MKPEVTEVSKNLKIKESVVRVKKKKDAFVEYLNFK